MTPVTSLLISSDESDLIRFLLNLNHRPAEVKAGLQRLCALYEEGRRLADSSSHLLLVRGLLLSDAIIIRRWAYKAIAWLGKTSDVDAIIALLANERDPENRTWAVAAIVSLAQNCDLEDVAARAGTMSATPLILASHLFPNSSWRAAYPDLPIINIDIADPLTLKWAALLTGYGRAPDNLFHPRIDNGQLLAKLNDHPDAEVSEYSVWALWQNPHYDIASLAIKMEDVKRHPKNVRRWINRLTTKTDDFLARNMDLLRELRSDGESSAREGLALGLKHLFHPGFEVPVLEWHSDETEDVIRELLLEHMAANSDNCSDYAQIAEESFRDAGQDSGIRKRLLTASAQRQLYSRLKGIAARQRGTDAGLPLMNITFGDVYMTTNFSAGRDIIGQNLVGGNMINSANDAIQKLTQTGVEKETLAQLLSAVGGANDLPDAHKAQIAAAVQKVATENSAEAKKSLVQVLKTAASAVGTAAGIATTLTTFATTVASWF